MHISVNIDRGARFSIQFFGGPLNKYPAYLKTLTVVHRTFRRAEEIYLITYFISFCQLSPKFA